VGQPVLAVEHRRQVVSLDAQQSTVDRTRFVAAHRHDAAFADAHFDAATGAAVTARGLVPFEVGVGDGSLTIGDLARRLAVGA